MDLHANTIEAFERDVIANETPLRRYMGDGDWRWLRFPYLHEGETQQKRQAVATFLTRRGYRIAQVSLSYDDWAFSDPYARCLAADDRASADRLEDRYLERAAAMLPVDLEHATLAFGHDIPHVLLLHAGAFTARVLPAFLDLLAARGFRFVTLQEAEADPAYAIPPGRPFPSGATWIAQGLAAKGPTPSAAPGADTSLDVPSCR
jgi:peptidoglycan/xylan/chitin deacetylase (PgdA/CDA1 family)